MYKKFAALAALVAGAAASRSHSQQVGTSSGGTEAWWTGSVVAISDHANWRGSVVIDANMTVHNSSTNCYDGNTWWDTLCPPDAVTCALNCADGAAYASTNSTVSYGPSMVQTTLELTDSLLNAEFIFDVDVSGLPCGLNGALYFLWHQSPSKRDGNWSNPAFNLAGAKYGTGYCDNGARDIKFIVGGANYGWSMTKMGGASKYTGYCDGNCKYGIGYIGEMDIWEANSISKFWDGSPIANGAGWSSLPHPCEMDIWEANSISDRYTPQPCDPDGPHPCYQSRMGDRYFYGPFHWGCDPDGCDFNRMGFWMYDKGFYSTVVLWSYLFFYYRHYYKNHCCYSIYLWSRRDLLLCSTALSTNPELRFLFWYGSCFHQLGCSCFLYALACFFRSFFFVRCVWRFYIYIFWSGQPNGISIFLMERTIFYQIWYNWFLRCCLWFFSFFSFFFYYSWFSSLPSSPSSSPRGSSTIRSSSSRDSSCSRCGGIGWTGPTTCASPYTCQKLNDWYSQCLL
uniref:cellulose 1,4-beta-cellobiosidase (non-reducing end) n=1 Tax=Botryotrichum murorum TaxID=1934362 RepID=T1WGY8_9PEZI|nr:cellobiohydrolase I [Botryotrichum murorum]